MQIYINLDGAILDVSRRYYAVYHDLLRQSGFVPFDIATYWSFKRLSISDYSIVDQNCTSGFSEDYKLMREIVLEDPAYLMLDELHPGVGNQLSEWCASHSLILLATRQNYQALVAQLEHLDIRPCFCDLIVNNSACPVMDSSKAHFQVHVKEPGSALIIGDNESAILAAHKLAIPSIAVTCGQRTRRLLEQVSPDLIVRDLAHIDERDWPVNICRMQKTG